MKFREFLAALAMMIPTLLLTAGVILTVFLPAECSLPDPAIEATIGPRAAYVVVACGAGAAAGRATAGFCGGTGIDQRRM